MSSRRDEIAQNLVEVHEKIAASAKKAERDFDEITLITVTKTFPLSDVKILYELGVTDFGENRDSEGAAKALAIPARWHFQGQIQSNKLKSICSWSNVIHSLDSMKHLAAISKVIAHPLEIFIQVNLDLATSRGGAAANDLNELADVILKSPKLSLSGLMAVAPLGPPPEASFAQLALIYKAFKANYPMAKSLSAGMSSDYEMAIAYGATHLRIGSSILGSRNPLR